MRAQTILFLSVDGVKEKLDCRPYRGRGEGNPKKLVEAASCAFPTRSIILTIRGLGKLATAYGCPSTKLETGSKNNWLMCRIFDGQFVHLRIGDCPSAAT